MQQIIETERLILRPFNLEDAHQVAELAGDKRVSEMTANIPHPYHVSNAIDWINTHGALFEKEEGLVYAITLKMTNDVIGAVSFPRLNDGLGILGYWLGVPFWGLGYAVEASNALIAFGQQNLGLNRLQVVHLVGNERSKSVIRKLGVKYIENRIVHIQGKNREVCVYASEV